MQKAKRIKLQIRPKSAQSNRAFAMPLLEPNKQINQSIRFLFRIFNLRITMKNPTKSECFRRIKRRRNGRSFNQQWKEKNSNKFQFFNLWWHFFSCWQRKRAAASSLGREPAPPRSRREISNVWTTRPKQIQSIPHLPEAVVARPWKTMKKKNRKKKNSSLLLAANTSTTLDRCWMLEEPATTRLSDAALAQPRRESKP